jgi:acetolactate decarboxylase
MMAALPLLLGAQEVQHAGAMRPVMLGQSLDNHLHWDTLSAAGLWGIAPLERLQGEVTVADGVVYAARVDAEGRLAMQQERQAASPFGVYAHAEQFASTPVQAAVEGLKALEELAAELAAQLGWEGEKPFLFRIQGEFAKVKIHVLDKPADEPNHNHELHHKAKRYFTYERITGELIGFYSTQHEGVYTHKGDYTHVHFLDAERQAMGHLDDIVIAGEVVFLLPVQ